MTTSLRDLRRQIDGKLASDARLNAFCLEHFRRSVYREFTRGMRRSEKVNLLLEVAPREALARALEQAAKDVDIVRVGGEEEAPLSTREVRVSMTPPHSLSTMVQKTTSVIDATDAEHSVTLKQIRGIDSPPLVLLPRGTSFWQACSMAATGAQVLHVPPGLADEPLRAFRDDLYEALTSTKQPRIAVTVASMSLDKSGVPWRHRPRLIRRDWRRVLAACLLAFLTLGTLSYWVLIRFPGIEPIGQRQCGIVVATPFRFALDEPPLCQSLREARTCEVRCLRLPMLGQDRFVERAQKSRAQVAIVLNGGTVRIFELSAHPTWLASFLKQGLTVQQSEPNDACLAALASRLAHQTGDIKEKVPRCPKVDQCRDYDLRMLHQNLCGSRAVDEKLLADVCRNSTVDDWRCMWASLLAFDSPWAADSIATKLCDSGSKTSAGLKFICDLVTIKKSCDEHADPDRAAKLLEKLAADLPAKSCWRIPLAGYAACLLHHDKTLNNAELPTVEELPIGNHPGESKKQCDLMRHDWWHFRAYFRGQAQRWNLAAQDYRALAKATGDLQYELSGAEMALQAACVQTPCKDTADAYSRLKNREHDAKKAAQAVQARYWHLRWLAGRRKRSDAQDFLDWYSRTLPQDARAQDGEPDENFVPLACGGKEPCAYKLLFERKSDRTVSKLRQALGLE